LSKRFPKERISHGSCWPWHCSGCTRGDRWTASAQVQTPGETPGRTLWDHNGSVMYLVANGASREFYYQKPRPGMLDAGARPGSLLFRGEVNSGEYSGTAYIFNPLCGPIPFEVKGASGDGDTRIVLTGEAPRVGHNCRASGSYTSTLEFRRTNLDEGANRPEEAMTTAPPPSSAPKPEAKPNASPAESGSSPKAPTTNEARSTAKNLSPDLAASTAASGSSGQIPIPNEAQRGEDLNKYLWAAAFVVMIIWLLIKLFGRTLIGMK